VDPAQFRKDFSGVMAARPRLPVQYFLYFESGGTSLTAESLTLLPKIITEVVGRPASDVSIIGHSDTVGKAESNEVLALKRAQSIAELLQEKGMKPFAMVVESHGERNLLVPTPDETPEPRNRRVEVSVR
jgi:outer membrane protein OmpA-like peptidoglycan-associated protein